MTGLGSIGHVKNIKKLIMGVKFRWKIKIGVKVSTYILSACGNITWKLVALHLGNGHAWDNLYNNLCIRNTHKIRVMQVQKRG